MHGRENPRYPYVITTYRLTEHHTSGAMSRWSSWLSELQPALFCEIDGQLAQEKGVANGDWVTITTSRSSIEARALVTDRVQPLKIGKRRRACDRAAVPLRPQRAGDGRRGERPDRRRARPQRAHPRGQGVHLRPAQGPHILQ